MPVMIENICSDFFTLWEQAKDRSFEEQLRLWKNLYEARHTEPARYAQYFQGPQKGPFPLRSGYFAGYRAVSTLSQRYSLIEMAHWDLITAAEHVRRVIQEG